MTRLLTLSRAARLVGVRRGALQKKIKDGELATFEGRITITELLRVYPNTHVEDNTILEHLERLKDDALAKRGQNRDLLPDADVLGHRLTALGQELAETTSALTQYSSLVDGLVRRLEAVERDRNPEIRSTAAELKNWVFQQLEKAPAPSDMPEHLLARDTILRVVAAHVRIVPSGNEYFVEGSDSLLEAAMRAGLCPNYGCSDGSCGMCTARVVSGEVKRIRRTDKVCTDRGDDQILMCCTSPVADLVIEAEEISGADAIPRQQVGAKVKRLRRPTDDITVLQLQTPTSARLRFMAGQRASLAMASFPAEDYSIASCQCDERILEFHIRRVDDSPVSEYIWNGLEEGAPVSVTGPDGDFVLDGSSPRSPVFIACDTGFAPVKGMIEHAMALDIAESLYLYWIGCGSGGHYFHNLCRSWDDAFDNFHYIPFNAAATNHDQQDDRGKAASPKECEVQTLLEKIVSDHAALAENDYYIAGPEPVVAAARAFLLERGVPPSQCFIEDI